MPNVSVNTLTLLSGYVQNQTAVSIYELINSIFTHKGWLVDGKSHDIPGLSEFLWCMGILSHRGG